MPYLCARNAITPLIDLVNEPAVSPRLSLITWMIQGHKYGTKIAPIWSILSTFDLLLRLIFNEDFPKFGDPKIGILEK